MSKKLNLHNLLETQKKTAQTASNANFSFFSSVNFNQLPKEGFWTTPLQALSFFFKSRPVRNNGHVWGIN